MDHFDVRPFPAKRRIIVDAGYLAHNRHLMHGFVEADITNARASLRAISEALGEKLSFTAFLAATFGRAIAATPRVQAYKNWRGKLVIFHDVDIATLIEPEEGGIAFPHILRRVNQKSVAELSSEIRAVQSRPESSAQSGGIADLAPHFPRFLRLMYFRVLKLNPHWFRNVAGTTVLTSIGMFGKRGGWGIGFLSTHTLGLTVGGIAQKPTVRDGSIEPGEFIQLTLSFDHDILDGAPATRFSSQFLEMLEAAEVLQE